MSRRCPMRHSGCSDLRNIFHSPRAKWFTEAGEILFHYDVLTTTECVPSRSSVGPGKKRTLEALRLEEDDMGRSWPNVEEPRLLLLSHHVPPAEHEHRRKLLLCSLVSCLLWPRWKTKTQRWLCRLKSLKTNGKARYTIPLVNGLSISQSATTLVSLVRSLQNIRIFAP